MGISDIKTQPTGGNMVVEIKGENLVISIPLAKPYQPSASGKSLTVASSRGIVQTAVQVDGKVLKIGVNAFIEK
jgi:hypothetical protein